MTDPLAVGWLLLAVISALGFSVSWALDQVRKSIGDLEKKCEENHNRLADEIDKLKGLK